LTTVTAKRPVEDNRDAGTLAVRRVVLSNAVWSDVEAHRTSDPVEKPVPVIVMVSPLTQTVEETGLSEVITGFSEVATVNCSGSDSTPQGVDTLMLAVPADAIRFAGTTAVSCNSLTKVT
jgi:hypothetical protein